MLIGVKTVGLMKNMGVTSWIKTNIGLVVLSSCCCFFYKAVNCKYDDPHPSSTKKEVLLLLQSMEIFVFVFVLYF